MKDWPYPHGGAAKVFDKVRSQDAIAFSRDGDLISQPRRGGSAIELWSLPSGSPDARLSGHSGNVTAYAVSPDGNWLSSAGDDNKVLLWSLNSFKLTNPVGTYTNAIRHLAFPNNSTLVTASAEGDLRSWAIPSGAAIRTFSLEGIGHITALVATPDGQYLIVGDSVGHLTIVSLKDGSIYERISAHQESVGSLIVTSDGTKFISSGGDGTAKVWSFSSRRVLGTFSSHQRRISSIAVGSNNDYAITGDADGVMILWSIITYTLITYFFDPRINSGGIAGTTYNQSDRITGKTITYTVPCGSPLPAGSTCVCNCVMGEREEAKLPSPPPRPSVTPRTPPVCTCQSVSVCTCQSVTVCTCQGVCACNLVCTCLAVAVCPPVLS